MVAGERREERESGHVVETAVPPKAAVAAAALAAVAALVVEDVEATDLAAVAEELVVASRSAAVEQKFAVFKLILKNINAVLPEVAAVLAAAAFAPVELALSG